MAIIAGCALLSSFTSRTSASVVVGCSLCDDMIETYLVRCGEGRELAKLVEVVLGTRLPTERRVLVVSRAGKPRISFHEDGSNVTFFSGPEAAEVRATVELAASWADVRQIPRIYLKREGAQRATQAWSTPTQLRRKRSGLK